MNLLRRNINDTVRNEEPEERDKILSKFEFPLKTNEELSEVERYIGNDETSLQFVSL